MINELFLFIKIEIYLFIEWFKFIKVIFIDRSDEEVEVDISNINNDVECKFEFIEKFIQEKKKFVVVLKLKLECDIEENINFVEFFIKFLESLMIEILVKVYLQ